MITFTGVTKRYPDGTVAVDNYGARPANAMFAAKMGAGLLGNRAQKVAEVHARFDVGGVCLAVYRDRYRSGVHHALP